jgi:hypothetical protein
MTFEAFGGNAGKILFVSSRNAPHEAPASHVSDRRKVTLSTGALREFVQYEDDLSAGCAAVWQYVRYETLQTCRSQFECPLSG